MSNANTVRFKQTERLLRLAFSAIDLIRAGKRGGLEVELLIDTLQRFKEGKIDNHSVGYLLQMSPDELEPHHPKVRGRLGNITRWVARRMRDHDMASMATLVQHSAEQLKSLGWTQTAIRLLSDELAQHDLRLGMSQKEIASLLSNK